MKLIKTLFKTIEQKSKLDLITELLIIGNSTENALILFNKVKANLLYEMKQREKQNALECRLINEFDRKEAKPYNPDFNKPLKDIEVNYDEFNHNDRVFLKVDRVEKDIEVNYEILKK